MAKLQTTWGLDLIDEALNHPDTIKVDASDMRFDGFRDDTRSEYRQRSVVRTEPSGSIAYEIPNDPALLPYGKRHLGFVVYDDSTGIETVEVWVNGAQQGTAVADANNRRERLFTLCEAHDFFAGDQIQLKTPPQSGGTYRIECLAFFSQLPPECQWPYKFDYVEAQPFASTSLNKDEVKSVRLTWLTTWPAQCQVKYWNESSPEDHTRVVEDGRWTNHRVILTGLIPDTNYFYKIQATDPSGNAVESEVQTFVTSAPLALNGSATSGRIPITVRNSTGIPYKSVPVTHGIPFPKGVLGSSSQLRMIRPEGDEIPLQARSLGNWLDGSVKWVILDFQAEVSPNSEGVYSLEYGSEIGRKTFDSKLTVNEGQEAVTIDTGRLKVKVDKSKFAPFAEVLKDNRPYLTAFWVEVNGKDGKKYVSVNSSPEVVKVEELGLQRCVVRVEGRHLSDDGTPLFRSICRLQFYVGLPFFRVDHTFVNDDTSERFTEIASMYLHFETHAGELEEVEIKQTHDDRNVYNGEVRQGRSDGVMQAGGVSVAMPDFWQQYPKSLKVNVRGIEVGICPAIEAGDYRDEGEDEHKLYFYLKDGVYRFREGLSKTHTLYIGQGIPSLPLPVPQVPPEWYCDSGAFGEILAAKSGLFPDYEDKVAMAFEGYLKNREAGSEYGMLNFGDWWGERRWNWGNSEYDTAFAFFLQWARSGDTRWFEEACQAAVHHRDVDTCRASADLVGVGGVYAHCIGHTGDYYPDGFRPGAICRGNFSVSHTWVDGFLLHHFLTGDLRSLETAQVVADRYDRHYTNNYDFTNCRNSGWHLIHSMAMYHATGDQFYLNAAHIIVKRSLERQTDDGGWRRMLVPGHCHCDPPRHTGNAGFMVGILLHGLKLYHQATADPKVAEAIVRGAEFLVDDMWIEDKDGFHYTSCPKSSLCVDNFHRGIDGIAYAWRVSKKRRFEPLLKRATQKAIDTLNPFGKSISASLRVAPNVLYDVARMEDKPWKKRC